MFCSKCGNELAGGSSFCGKCGNPISQNPVHAADATMPGAISNSAPAGAAAAKKKPVLPIALAVIVIAVIGVAVATGGFGFLGSDSGVSTTSSLEEYTWEELSAISAEIAEASDEDEAIEIAKKYDLVNEDGTLDGTQTKSVTLSDGTVTSVQIAGFLHDDKSDGSGKAGITFIFTDAIAEMYMNSDDANFVTGDNSGGWESSYMRSWLASEGMALLPEELQDVIVAVDKSTNNVGNKTKNVSSVTITSDELWLLSFVELAGEVDESDFYNFNKYEVAIFNAEGSQYKLFSDYSVTDSSSYHGILAKTYQDESDSWWERSPDPSGGSSFMYVGDGGYMSHNISDFASFKNAVVPGFCI